MDRISRLRSTGRALRHRNFRLFFFGQGISLIGTWLTRMATSWLIYRLTGSAWLLGVVSFASQAPSFFLSPLAGVWVDRLNRHRVLLATQVLALVQSGLLALFALRGTIAVAHVVALSLFQGLINVFDIPARQTLFAELIDDRADLPNAVALNSSIVNAARLIGPSIGGFLIAAVGEGMCFLIDAVSYVAVIGSLLAIRMRPHGPRPAPTRIWTELTDGFRYVRTFRPIRALLGLLMISGIAGMPYTVLTPALATRVLHGGAHTLGVLMAASGLGALFGALYLAGRSSVVGLGRVVARCSFLFGASLIALGLSPWLALSIPLMASSGLAMMVQMAAANTVLQTLADEEKRGRVMGFYAMAVFGSMPFGSLLAGWSADLVGIQVTLCGGGIVCVLAGLGFWRRLPEMRRIVWPIYEKLGILPELAEGIEQASRASSEAPPA